MVDDRQLILQGNLVTMIKPLVSELFLKRIVMIFGDGSKILKGFPCDLPIGTFQSSRQLLYVPLTLQAPLDSLNHKVPSGREQPGPDAELSLVLGPTKTSNF